MTTELIVRIKAPFTLLRQSEKRSDVYADVTNDYERGWKDGDHFFWLFLTAIIASVETTALLMQWWKMGR